ncbi:2-oxo acid dehydrogenase subunit E2 [Leptolyngbya sp. AN02str]|uniref:2-oxo acid dehydrogenase subunit E2 n=1 Tax=Leptolyngbya sp. AN02str TaxID=3423363 RepID=UPI003D31FAF1
MQSPDLIGSYEKRKFSSFRNPTIDILIWGRQRHHIPMLLEVDVTAAREAIDHQKQQGKHLSFTGWFVKCIAQAVSEHKAVHALRQGDQLIIFDDVDVTVIVERAVGSTDSHETLPMPYMIRQANQKSVADISSEIRAAQQHSVALGEVQINSTHAPWVTKLSTRVPKFLRDWFFWRPLFRNPFLFKRMMGTVSVTSLGMVGQRGMSWGIPIGIHPLIVSIGAIAKRPGVVHDQILIREYVGLTVLFDHDVIDGAPVARFIKRLSALVTQGFGLISASEELD